MVFARNLTLGLALLAFVGCGGSGASDLPDLGKVTGVVTLDGAPLADATVSFQSKEAGRMASGKTDAQGRYTLYLLNDIEGAPVGQNEVYITTAVPADDADPKSGKPERLPAKYNAKTTLSAEVEPGKNEFNFDLQSK